MKGHGLLITGIIVAVGAIGYVVYKMVSTASTPITAAQQQAANQLATGSPNGSSSVAGVIGGLGSALSSVITAVGHSQQTPAQPVANTPAGSQSGNWPSSAKTTSPYTAPSGSVYTQPTSTQDVSTTNSLVGGDQSTVDTENSFINYDDGFSPQTGASS